MADKTPIEIEQKVEEPKVGGFSMPKIFDLTHLTQSKESPGTAGKVFNYFWKTFDFRNGRTLETN